METHGAAMVELMETAGGAQHDHVNERVVRPSMVLDGKKPYQFRGAIGGWKLAPPPAETLNTCGGIGSARSIRTIPPAPPPPVPYSTKCEPGDRAQTFVLADCERRGLNGCEKMAFAQTRRPPCHLRTRYFIRSIDTMTVTIERNDLRRGCPEESSDRGPLASASTSI
uniref:Uncharacterized protein n=1 Tax=Anopheles coluzzii TaxID=1518534 RepID=A0A8W7P9P6_ANOCL